MLRDARKSPSLDKFLIEESRRERVESAIIKFEDRLEYIVQTRNIPHRHIRPLAPGSIVCVTIEKAIFVGYLPHLGMPSLTFIEGQADAQPNLASFHEFLLDQTTQNFSVTLLNEEWLDLPTADSESRFDATAMELIRSELSRAKVSNAMIPFNPVFGPNRFPIQDSLVFVLMPFTDQLTQIYQDIIKPSVESKNLVARRADEINSNNAVMHDIWKSICEARFVIADLTGRNPNVMYELGIAHTVGKQVIMIYQNDDQSRFPFDISHMRIIKYDNTAAGGSILRRTMDSTIENVLAKISTDSVHL
jgi:hypothetical protein